MATKSVFKSLGFMGGLFTIGSGAIATLSSPAFYGKAQECLTAFGHNDFAASLITLTPVLTMVFGSVSSYGRYRRGDLHTPQGLPGQDRQSDPVVPANWDYSREVGDE